MANEIKYQDVVATLESLVGNQYSHYNSMMTEYLDSINWYAQKKAGETTWCCILNDYAIAVNRGNLSVDQARVIACEPVPNYGAGVKEKIGYFKQRGRWFTDPSKATTGDQIFLNGEKHTGTITSWDSSGFWYVDGSTTYNGKPYSVGKKHLSFKASKIDGFGRPDWYKYQTADTPTAPSTNNGVTDQLLKDLAYKCIRGDFGNGLTRKQRINGLGYGAIYSQVQNYVNMILRGQIK